MQFKAEVELETQNQEADMAGPSDETVASTVACSEDVSMYSDDDEDLDNLCRICDERRATLKCKECDGDLFCIKCFKELHTELGEIHKPTILKK